MKREPWLMVGVFVALWAVLALVSPSRTYHLAPAIIGGWPLIGSKPKRPTPDTGRRIRLVGLGVGVAVATTTVLKFAGGLTGPSLLPVGGAALEAFVFSVAGGLIALGIPTIGREQN